MSYDKIDKEKRDDENEITCSGFRHFLPRILITKMQKCFILSKLFAFLFCQILYILMLYGVVFYVIMVLKVIFHEA